MAGDGHTTSNRWLLVMYSPFRIRYKESQMRSTMIILKKKGLSIMAPVMWCLLFFESSKKQFLDYECRRTHIFFPAMISSSPWSDFPDQGSCWQAKHRNQNRWPFTASPGVVIKSGGGRFFFGSLLVCKNIFFSGCSFTEYLLLSFHCFFFPNWIFFCCFLMQELKSSVAKTEEGVAKLVAKDSWKREIQ